MALSRMNNSRLLASGTDSNLAFLPTPSVTSAVTADAKRNQVVHDIATELVSSSRVMDFQAFHRTAPLTPPTISFEHAIPDNRVLLRIQLEPRSFLAKTR